MATKKEKSKTKSSAETTPSSDLKKIRTSTVERVEAAVLELVEATGNDVDGELIMQTMRTVLHLVEDDVSRGDLKLINNTLRDIRHGLKVFADYRSVRKVSIFGSARTEREHPAYKQAVEFSRKIADQGFMVITGAGHGIMEAGQFGATRARSFGVNIRLPFEQVPNAIIGKDAKLVNFKYFFTRKLMFVKETSGLACFPGGFGTHDEAFEVLTLIQTGKSYPMPIVFLDRPGGAFWKDWEDYVRDRLLKNEYISEEDMALFTITDDVDEAVDIIKNFYRVYHSIRYVGDKLVIRLSQPAPDALVENLNQEFADIVEDGKIEKCGPLRAERNEPMLASLPRLMLEFNRRHLGRLRQMIDYINNHG